MAIKFKRTEATTQTEILMFPDMARRYAQLFEKDSPLAVTVDGRKIIKAGTIIPANDKTAKGLVDRDLDVTDGDQNGAVIFVGEILVSKIPAAPTPEAVLALKRVTFFDEHGLVVPVYA